MNYTHRRISHADIAQNLFNKKWLNPFIEFQRCFKLLVFIPYILIWNKIRNVKLDFEKSFIFNVETKIEEISGWFSTVCLINFDVFNVVIMETVFWIAYIFSLCRFSVRWYMFCFIFFMISTSYIYTVKIGTNFNPFSTSATD